MRGGREGKKGREFVTIKEARGSNEGEGSDYLVMRATRAWTDRISVDDTHSGPCSAMDSFPPDSMKGLGRARISNG